MLKKFLIKIYTFYFDLPKKIFFMSKKHLENKRGLEIGGPTRMFSKKGAVPLYTVIRGLDNVNFNSNNFWSKLQSGGKYIFDDSKESGTQIIHDSVDLSSLKDESYDFVLSSHVLEHIANPIKALKEWDRVIVKGGYLFCVVPDMRYTYDRKRPLTEFNHILQDYLNNTSEDDNTHFEEVIQLHDLRKDSTVNSFEEHQSRTLDNFTTRICHHHTFDENLLKDMLEHCQFKVIMTQTFKPYHIAIFAQKGV